jgi:transposase-like protein
MEAKGCEIIKCSCQHKDQDKFHGKGHRVCNMLSNGQFKCTVCGRTHGNIKASKE